MVNRLDEFLQQPLEPLNLGQPFEVEDDGEPDPDNDQFEFVAENIQPGQVQIGQLHVNGQPVQELRFGVGPIANNAADADALAQRLRLQQLRDEDNERAIQMEEARRRIDARGLRAVGVPDAALARPGGNNTRVVVDGNEVRVLREDVLSKMSLESFFQSFIHESSPQFDGLLPSGTRLVQRSGDNVKFLVELEPSIQNVGQVGNKTRYQIALPWQYFYFVFNKKAPNKAGITWAFDTAKVYWSRNKYDGNPAKSVMFARLPNIYQNSAKICFGNTAPDSTLPLHTRIETVINDFYSPDSEFNGDLGWNFPNGYRSFRDWARDTKENPLCFLNWYDFTDDRGNMVAVARLFPATTKMFHEGSFNEFAYAVQKSGGASF